MFKPKKDKEKNNRFEVTHTEHSTWRSILIIRDRCTGVLYMCVDDSMHTSGLTPLLDENGKPIVERSERV